MSYDVRLSIRMIEGLGYSVDLTLPDGRTAREEIDVGTWAELGGASGTMMERGSAYANLLWRGEIGALLASALSEMPSWELGRIFFDSDSTAIGQTPWEAVLLAPPLISRNWVFIYWSNLVPTFSQPAPRLPLQCLTASVGSHRPYDVRKDLANVIPNPDVNVSLTFEIGEVRGTMDDVRAAIRIKAPELVLLWISEGADFDHDSLGALIATPGIRLLMLHFDETNEAVNRSGACLPPIRAAQEKGAPAIIVTEGRESFVGYFYLRLFEQIVHNQPLDIAFFQARRELTPLSTDMITRLFLSNGSEDLLRLSTVADVLKEDVEDAILEIQAELADGSISSESAALAIATFQEVAAESEMLTWDHERRGLIPLAELKERYHAGQDLRVGQKRRGDRTIASERYVPEPGEPRVINVSFLGRGGIVAPSDPLTAGTRYDFRLQIGRHLPESIVRNPTPVPETELARFMRPDGLALRVVLSSREFELIDAEAELILPPRGPSELIHFRVRTPSSTGDAQLRAAVYYQTNLLQSIRVTADVVARDSLVGGTNSAEVEYCICGTMRGIEMYEPRTLSILLNESQDGTHTFAVVGTQIRRDFTFTEGEMRGSLDDARKMLFSICADVDKSGKPTRYRYSSTNNEGLPTQFVSDIKKLAYVGCDLFTVFVMKKNKAFAEQLRKELAHKVQIQIASTRSANYVFPWALVYDKELMEDDGNVVCDQFLSDIGSKGGDFTCLSSGCPNAEDRNVICPSGFWGYRHIVEQPPSIAEDDETPGRDLPMHIDLDGDPKVMMGISLELEFPEEHFQQLKTVGQYHIELARDKTSVVKALESDPVPNLVYFYCHGGKENGKAFLGIGNKQRLLSREVANCRLNWQKSHPLVFINGCRTAELSPDDLLTFVTTFAFCQAAGVIGAEITIPESLAREFAAHFFSTMLEPALSVGEAIRRGRLSLLHKYNLLGLAYTPFCHSSLHFSRYAL